MLNRTLGMRMLLALPPDHLKLCLHEAEPLSSRANLHHLKTAVMRASYAMEDVELSQGMSVEAKRVALAARDFLEAVANGLPPLARAHTAVRRAFVTEMAETLHATLQRLDGVVHDAIQTARVRGGYALTELTDYVKRLHPHIRVVDTMLAALATEFFSIGTNDFGRPDWYTEGGV